MFYRYFGILNCICNVFGVSKPYITSEFKSVPTNILVKIWCLIIAAILIASYCLTTTTPETNLKSSLELVSYINDLSVNVVIIILSLFNGTKVYVNIHKTFNIIFSHFNFDASVLKLFAIKLYFWFSIPAILFIIPVIMELMSNQPPYDLIIRIPMFLSMTHLFMHLYVILALLKVLNSILSKTVIHGDKISHIEDPGNSIMYVLNPTIKFYKLNDYVHFDLKLLCKIYDNLSTSAHLLEEIHSFEVLLSIWLMFTSGVVGMTLIVCNQATIQWLVIVESVMPYFWGFIGCCISELTQSEVNETLTLIIKCLIDNRCGPTMKPTLETFKQLVSNDRLQFTACSLFHLSYAMLLGTMLNVLTYSIILIQMFWN